MKPYPITFDDVLDVTQWQISLSLPMIKTDGAICLIILVLM